MKYLAAFVCPPWGLYLSRCPIQATLAVLVEILALSFWSSGLGPMLHAVCIVWALHLLGAHCEKLQVDSFVKRIHNEAYHF